METRHYGRIVVGFGPNDSGAPATVRVARDISAESQSDACAAAAREVAGSIRRAPQRFYEVAEDGSLSELAPA